MLILVFWSNNISSAEKGSSSVMLVAASQDGHLTTKQQLPMSHFCETPKP